MTDHPQRPQRTLRQEMIATCLRINATGLNQGTSGNLSVRLSSGGFLITPSSTPYERMIPADMAVMQADGSWSGPRNPSSEWRFHRDIMAARPDCTAILHTHSPFATALAVHLRGIPAFHYMVCVAGGDDIRCAPYATFGSQQLSDLAIAALLDRNACLLGHHGQIALGATLEKAFALATEVETLAKMYIHALALGEPAVLSADEMARVLGQMRRMSYGQAAT